jgi:adenine-specific DNA-methyltransferase
VNNQQPATSNQQPATSNQQPATSNLGQSLDIASEKLAQFKALFPEVFSEHQIDLDRLKQTLGIEAFTCNEHYELSWAGKSAARSEIEKTTSNTLIPNADNSSHARHVFIEGKILKYYGCYKSLTLVR